MAWLAGFCFVLFFQLDCKWRPHKSGFSPSHPQKNLESVGSRATNGHGKSNSEEWGCPQVRQSHLPWGDGFQKRSGESHHAQESLVPSLAPEPVLLTTKLFSK